MANRGLLSLYVAGRSYITRFINLISPQTPPEKNPHLNADTFLETMIRTCARSLLRFQAVSRSWFFFINHPGFVREHLRCNRARNREMLCNCLTFCESHNIVSFLRAKGPEVSIFEVDRRDSYRADDSQTRLDFFNFARKMIICGSVNGIVCICHSKEFGEKFLGLWNPAVMKWKPVVLPSSKKWVKASVGLGYDKVNDDLKIVCLVPFGDGYGAVCGSVVEIYSASNDEWDDVDESRDISFFTKRRNCQFIVKDVPYWTGSDSQVGDVLARIDPCTGVYMMFNYPTHGTKNNVYPLNVNDSVFCLVESFVKSPTTVLDMYCLDEVTSEWNMLYRLGPFESFVRAPQCLPTGEIVIVRRKTKASFPDDICFFDPETDTLFCNDKIQCLVPCWEQSFCHVESLVCLDGMVVISRERVDKEPSLLLRTWKELMPEDFQSVLLEAVGGNP